MKDTMELELNFLDIDKALKLASKFAGDKFDEAMEIVLRTAFLDKRNLPSLRLKSDSVITLNVYVEKWVNAYLNGKNNRPSLRIGNPSSVYPDTIIKTVFDTCFPNLEKNQSNLVDAGHSFYMTIENIIGDLLEEYLSIKLSKYGWYCCWGSTIDAVDFCQKNGDTLQVKNSDNSENSSSKRVRNGTLISKWFRRCSTKKDTYNWVTLQQLTGCKDLSEPEFRIFVMETVKMNPKCIYMPKDNPFQTVTTTNLLF